MTIGDFNITKDLMPSYEIGKDYPLRQYAFMQGTLQGALAKQAQLQNPQNGVNTTQNPNAATTQSSWGGQQ